MSAKLIRLLRNFVFLMVVLYLLGVLSHRFWLPFAAEYLVLEEEPRSVDLIVVATPFRPRFLYALDLMQKGYADRILLLGDARIKMVWSGKTSLELARDESLKRGVPDAKIYTMHSTGTRGDAKGARDLMSFQGFQSAMVVSDPYNMRRLAMIFDRVFSGSGRDLVYVPAGRKRNSPDYWWRSTHSFVYVVKEWMKLPINWYMLSADSGKKEEEQGKFDAEFFKYPSEGFLEGRADDYYEPVEPLEEKFVQRLGHRVRFGIGGFLVVDQRGNKTDAAITSKISENVLLCYRSGNCRKILVLKGASSYTRANVDPDRLQARVQEEADAMGVDPSDLIFM
ncbi:MAG: YdcF family protein, partial [Nitrospinae bacterium]|nr:YdcF family protein [Nitrospinota bacterium]